MSKGILEQIITFLKMVISVLHGFLIARMFEIGQTKYAICVIASFVLFLTYMILIEVKDRKESEDE